MSDYLKTVEAKEALVKATRISDAHQSAGLVHLAALKLHGCTITRQMDNIPWEAHSDAREAWAHPRLRSIINKVMLDAATALDEGEMPDIRQLLCLADAHNEPSF